MSCPNENDYARMLDGLVSQHQRRLLEEHIDGCSACHALLTELGKLYAPADGERLSVAPKGRVSQPPPATTTDRAVGSSRQLLTLELALLSVHLVWASLSLPLAWRAVLGPVEAALSTEHSVQSPPSVMLAVLAMVVLCYAAMWAPLGALWTGLSAYGFWRGRNWARRAAKLHAVISLPSLVLLPLGLLVLVELRRLRPG